MSGIYPETVYNYLKGINYPASKDELLEQARKNNANHDVLEAMGKLPDKEYDSQDDVILTGSKMTHQR